MSTVAIPEASAQPTPETAIPVPLTPSLLRLPLSTLLLHLAFPFHFPLSELDLIVTGATLLRRSMWPDLFRGGWPLASSFQHGSAELRQPLASISAVTS